MIERNGSLNLINYNININHNLSITLMFIINLLKFIFNKREKCTLYTNWDSYNTNFKVYTSYSELILISKREFVLNGKEVWFCIDYLKDEILDYGIKNNLKFPNIEQTIEDIHSYGYSYRLKDIEATKKIIEDRGGEIILLDYNKNKNRNKNRNKNEN